MLANKLTEYRNDRSAKKSAERLGNLSISDLPYCGRKIAYKYHGVKPSNVNDSGAMDVGTVFHEVIQKWAKDCFGDDFHSIEREVSIPVHYKDPKTGHMEVAFIKGHVDGVFVSEEYTYAVDFKTYRGFAWKYRSPVKDNYKDQLCCYIEGLKDHMEIDRGLICHIKKDDMEMDESVIKPNKKRVEKLKLKAADILGTEIPEEIPAEPEFDWECRKQYCPYYDICKGEE